MKKKFMKLQSLIKRLFRTKQEVTPDSLRVVEAELSASIEKVLSELIASSAQTQEKLDNIIGKLKYVPFLNEDEDKSSALLLAAATQVQGKSRFKTVKDSAKEFAVKECTIRDWIKRGKLKAYKPGGKTLVVDTFSFK